MKLNFVLNLACRVTWFEVKQQFVNHKKDLRNQGEVRSCVVTAGWLPQWVDEDRWIWRFKVLLYRKRMLKTASLLSTDQLSQQSGQWSCMLMAGHPFMSLTNTHTHTNASHSIPCCPPQIFRGVPETVSLIWFTLSPSLPSCLDSHLLYVFFLSRRGKKMRGLSGGGLVGHSWVVTDRKNVWMCFG